MAPIGTIPPIHGLYMFNPNACITAADVKGGGYDANGNFIGPDKCVICGPIVPPPPPPVIPVAGIYSIMICFALLGPGPTDYAPQGCWHQTTYVNYDGPPPLNFVDQPYPLVAPHVYPGYTLTIDTVYGYDSTQVGENTVTTGPIYTVDPNNPSAPATYNFDATQAAATAVINNQLNAAYAVLGIP